MFKGNSITLMDPSMWENGKMGNIMEKASSLFIMVTILRVNGGMVNLLDM